MIGRYLAGLAHELEGNEDSAFIDYYDAWRIARAAPPGAPASVEHLGPWLVREARRLGRKELPELEAAYPGVEAGPQDAADTGEVVVIVEVGRIPERVVAGPQGAGFWTVRARPWPRGATLIESAEQLTSAETVTSLENLFLRRGALGALTDTERVPSLWVNTALVGAYFLLPPVGGVLLLRRAYEVTVRMAQGWLSLPAEFRVARLRLPVGTQTLRLRTGEAVEEKAVVVNAGRPAVILVQFPPEPGQATQIQAAR